MGSRKDYVSSDNFAICNSIYGNEAIIEDSIDSNGVHLLNICGAIFSRLQIL